MKGGEEDEEEREREEEIKTGACHVVAAVPCFPDFVPGSLLTRCLTRKLLF
jgi:hypothetical protein